MKKVKINVAESLAGRVAILDLEGMTVYELGVVPF